MNELVGQTILKRYHVQRLVGRGGMSRVFMVWDQLRAAPLAMKVLHDDLATDRVFIRRFQREATTLERLQHPNIVRFYGLEQDHDLVFMLLDFVEGNPLKRVIFEQGGPLPLARVVEIMRAISSALHFAHQLGIVHSDVKPGNILINNQGHVLVTDFGIARMTESATLTLVGAGTPAYMPPEQILGKAPSPFSDQYSFAVLLFEMITGGERPFTGDLATIQGSLGERIRWEHLNVKPPNPKRWNPDLPDGISDIILRALSKDPSKRFPSIMVFRQTFEKIALKYLENRAPPVRVDKDGLDDAEIHYGQEIKKLDQEINQLRHQSQSALGASDWERLNQLTLKIKETEGKKRELQENIRRIYKIRNARDTWESAMKNGDTTQAEEIIETLKSLGGEGNKVAERLQAEQEAKRKEEEKLKAEIEKLCQEIEQAITEEAWEIAKAGLEKLNSLGPGVRSRVTAYKTQLSKAEADERQRNAKIAQLQEKINRALEDEEFHKAKSLLTELKAFEQYSKNLYETIREEIERAENQHIQQLEAIQHLETELEENIKAEDWGAAHQLLEDLDRLGKQGSETAKKWNVNVKQAKAEAEQRIEEEKLEAQIEKTKSAAQQAISNEDWVEAGTLLKELKTFGLPGREIAIQIEKKLKIAKQAAKKRKRETEKARLQAQIQEHAEKFQQAIEVEDWEGARVNIHKLRTLGPQGKREANRLDKRLKKARIEAEKLQKEVIKAGLQEQVQDIREAIQDAIDEENWDEARERSQQLRSLGPLAKKAALQTEKRIKAAQAEAEKRAKELVEADQRDQIRLIKATFQEALAEERWDDAEGEIHQLQALGPSGKQEATQLKRQLNKAQAEYAQQQEKAEEARQKAQIQQIATNIEIAIDSEKWNTAETLIGDLRNLGPAGEKAATLKRRALLKAKSATEKLAIEEDAREPAAEEETDVSKTPSYAGTTPPPLQQPVVQDVSLEEEEDEGYRFLKPPPSPDELVVDHPSPEFRLAGEEDVTQVDGSAVPHSGDIAIPVVVQPVKKRKTLFVLAGFFLLVFAGITFALIVPSPLESTPVAGLSEETLAFFASETPTPTEEHFVTPTLTPSPSPSPTVTDTPTPLATSTPEIMRINPQNASDIRETKPLKLDKAKEVHALALYLSPKGLPDSLAVTGHQEIDPPHIRFWSLDNGSQLSTPDEDNNLSIRRIDSILFSHQGSYLVTIDEYNKVAYLWEADPHTPNFIGAYTFDNQAVLSSHPDQEPIKAKAKYAWAHSPVAAFSNDEKYIAIAFRVGLREKDTIDPPQSYLYQILLIDIQSGNSRSFEIPEEGENAIYGMAFTSDSKDLVLLVHKSIQLINFSTGKIRQTSMMHNGIGVIMAPSSVNPNHVATGTRENSVYLWQLSTQKALWKADIGSKITSLSFSPDGTLLVVGDADGELMVWDVAKGRRVFRQRAHNTAILSIAFTPDGQFMFSGSQDGKILQWGLKP